LAGGRSLRVRTRTLPLLLIWPPEFCCSATAIGPAATFCVKLLAATFLVFPYPHPFQIPSASSPDVTNIIASINPWQPHSSCSLPLPLRVPHSAGCQFAGTLSLSIVDCRCSNNISTRPRCLLVEPQPQLLLGTVAFVDSRKSLCSSGHDSSISRFELAIARLHQPPSGILGHVNANRSRPEN
jgi:hypothetical protein